MRSGAADRGSYSADAERYIWWVSVAGALIIREGVVHREVLAAP